MKKEIKCWYCDREHQFLCDGDECDRPICDRCRTQLGVLHVGGRSHGLSYWDSIDVCPECLENCNHYILRHRDRASPEYISKLLKRASSVRELKELKGTFEEQKIQKAWHLLSKSDRTKIKRICNENLSN